MDPFSLKLLIFVAIIVISVGLGWFIANGLRMKEYSGKISFIIFTLFFGLSPFINKVLVDKKPALEALRFGIDLAGGTNLVYQMQRPPENARSMENMVGAIRRRIDPSGTQELAIRQVGKDRVEIIIPRASQEAIANIKAQMNRIGSLEFHLLANRTDDGNLIERAMSAERDVRDANGRIIGGWRPVAPVTTDDKGKKIPPRPNPDFQVGERFVARQRKGEPDGFLEVLCKINPDETQRVTGDRLTRANPDQDRTGRPAVSFTFDQRGAHLFSALTGNNLPSKDGFHRRLAILLDGSVHSAPQINSQIGAHGIIEGRFTSKEVKDLTDVLNAGALDVPLKPDPISEFSISPLLGVDVQNKGFTALILATVGVLVFMIVYYFYLGLIADLCLLLNLILLVGIMSMIDATFTLPGLAGVVLTMGMAVDANVLIYERMREELAKSSSLRMAIHNGFSRAFSSIFDSNITTLLTAVILYMIGSDQVRGFAVTLFIGLAVSMYTALTVNRVILEIIERKKWLKKFNMMNSFGETHFDFVSKQLICAAGSLLLIVVGLAAFFARGQSGYDIDFTGGTMVTMEFNQKQSADDVRNKLTSAFKSDITLEELNLANNKDVGTRFRLRTTDQDELHVRQVVNDTFKDQLKRITLHQFTDPKLIVAAATDSKPADAKPDEKKADEKKPDEKAPVVQTEAEKRFAGGHESTLTFSEASTRYHVPLFRGAVDYDQGADGKPKYGAATDSVAGLFDLTDPTATKTELGDAGKVRSAQTMLLKTDKAITLDDLKVSLAQMKNVLANSPLFDEINNFESAVATETKQSAVIAMLASLVMIVIYIWFRFENVYFGYAAVLALAHDVLVTLGMVSLAALIANTPVGAALMLNDFKINLTMIAAFLTIVGYSLNDTIVIFDRLREIRGKNPDITRDMINLAVNQTLSRTILTAGTVFITVVILYVMGGEGIHGFAYAMLIGTVVGCYSTIYVASPAGLWFMKQTGHGGKSPAKSSAPAKVTT
ncbi:MAG: protein translocase subunit SecD [Planctomycetales bacterium]